MQKRIPSKRIRFIKSAAHPQDYPLGEIPEVAIVGRSNSGKSSFINALANEIVARVSQTPGKTRLLNFFNAGDHYRWVDMPGYGYAARQNDELKNWRRWIESYLSDRPQLKGLLLLLDARREWEQEENLLYQFCFHHHIPIALILTKIDKLNQKELSKVYQKWTKQFGKEGVFLISSLSMKGVHEVEEFVFRNWVLEI